MQFEFIDELDHAMAHEGPAGIFTLNHDSLLALDLVRSRDFRTQNQGPFPIQWCHCVLVDGATQWPQYALITSPALTQQHSRAEIHVFTSQAEALEARKRWLDKLYREKGNVTANP